MESVTNRVAFKPEQGEFRETMVNYGFPQEEMVPSLLLITQKQEMSGPLVKEGGTNSVWD